MVLKEKIKKSFRGIIIGFLFGLLSVICFRLIDAGKLPSYPFVVALIFLIGLFTHFVRGVMFFIPNNILEKHLFIFFVFSIVFYTLIGYLLGQLYDKNKPLFKKIMLAFLVVLILIFIIFLVIFGLAKMTPDF